MLRAAHMQELSAYSWGRALKGYSRVIWGKACIFLCTLLSAFKKKFKRAFQKHSSVDSFESSSKISILNVILVIASNTARLKGY